jgi:hypothetical protein
MQVQRRVAFAIATLLLMLCPRGVAGGSKAALASSTLEYEFHSVLPLGSDLFVIHGFRGSVALMATALTPDLDGWKRVHEGGSRFLFTSDGQRARFYPRQVKFRVSALALDRPPVDYEPLAVTSSLPINDYLLALRFQVRIFHGLHMRVVEPSNIHMVGVPADIPYSERIYRLTFDLPQVPVQDRMVLEVLSPDGVRLSRFHFELM